MIIKRLSTKALLFAALQITTQALPNVAPASSTKTLTTTPTPTPTVVGMPAIATITNENCNVEGTIPAESMPYHSGMGVYHPLQCMYACMQTTFCQTYSWNTTDADPAFNNYSCTLYAASISSLKIVPEKTGIFFSVKRSGCYEVAQPEKLTSKPFAGEKGVYVNTAVSDCGIEGSYVANAGGPTAQYRYDSVLECQSLCDSQNGCTTYSWDTNAEGKNCGFTYAWLAGRIIPGKTGVYWSEGAEKTGYPCFSDKPLGS